ncbi:MAG: hypothetical protein RMJ34_05910 [candidate division WOR-3 bacterium]|nr:hypothetical protein [candidate division WOR-3 bacterium]
MKSTKKITIVEIEVNNIDLKVKEIKKGFVSDKHHLRIMKK